MFIKPYEQLEFKDNFMFCKIMYSQPDLCKEVIETLLQIKIEKIEYLAKEYKISASMKGKGVRLDVYVKNQNEIFDVEMQTCNYNDLGLRTRYSQTMIDWEHLDSGKDYEELPKTYIIFICLNDPFNKNLPHYEFENTCKQDKNVKLNDKILKVFYNCSAAKDEQNKEIKNLLEYIKSSQTTGNLTSRLDSQVNLARKKEKWRDEYMFPGLVVRDARAEGKREGLAEGRAEAKTEKLQNAVALYKENVSSDIIEKTIGINLQQIKDYMKEHPEE